jgi:molecular chaperone DnaK (HSP70)
MLNHRGSTDSEKINLVQEYFPEYSEKLSKTLAYLESDQAEQDLRQKKYDLYDEYKEYKNKLSPYGTDYWSSNPRKKIRSLIKIIKEHEAFLQEYPEKMEALKNTIQSLQTKQQLIKKTL